MTVPSVLLLHRKDYSAPGSMKDAAHQPLGSRDPSSPDPSVLKHSTWGSSRGRQGRHSPLHQALLSLDWHNLCPSICVCACLLLWFLSCLLCCLLDTRELHALQI